ncbi:MAG: hypothetical protein QMD03_08300 [Syntrophales bacterium]|nr:hypothetical protein [Syntrophales bacterium]
MKHRFRVIVVLLLTGCFILPGCGGDKTKIKQTEGPAQIKAIPFDGAFNPEGGRVTEGITLTAKAAERIGIETIKIKETLAGQGPLRKVIPYASVLYDPNGQTWVYTVRKPLIYLREPITIDSIEDEMAILSKGPEVGTTIVTIGIAMLYGVECGIGQ